MLVKTTSGIATSHQRAGKLLFSHLTHMSQNMLVSQSFEEQLMVQNDAQAGAFHVSIGPGDGGTHDDVSVGIDIVKRMYPERYMMRLNS